MNWTSVLLEQLTFHWENQVRPGLDGLTDDEYLWEPVPGAWSIRPRAEARTAMAAGGGALVADFEYPEPVPAPVTTIAWRMGHVIVGIFGARIAAHFAGPPMDYFSVVWPADAQSALAMLDDVYAGWVRGVGDLDETKLAQPVGESGGRVRRLAIRCSRAPHQPGGHPPHGRGGPTSRPLPGAALTMSAGSGMRRAR